jgi:hypothetical protein
MKRIWHHHGLSIVLLGFFVITLMTAQFFTGRFEYNEERADRNLPAVGPAEYLRSPHFLEATTENWESEFFQMFVYVALTAFLYQKGSAESNDPDKPQKKEPPLTKRSPWAARRGGWVRKIYEHSLSLAFLVFFLITLFLHAASGVRLRNEEEAMHGHAPQTMIEYMGSSRFWFESFQNWQSEFLAIGSMVVLSIFLREKNSPESKPVNMPHSDHEA